MGDKIISNESALFKRELAEDGRASFSTSYVKKLHFRNSPVKDLFANIMIDKLIMALIDSGSSVYLLENTLPATG